VLRRRLAVLLAAAMMLVMAASSAWAESAPGNGKGIGLGFGGGDTAHPNDNGKHNAKGGGYELNNPHGC